MVQHVYTQVTSYQVLQRDFSTNTALVKQANGEVRSLPIGGPYTINNASNVLVGDVWVMSGQSNMRGNAFYSDPWADPPTTYPEYVDGMVHLFQSNESWTLGHEPTHRIDQSVRQVDYDLPDPSVSNKNYYKRRGVSCGMAFAKAYRERIDVPVGLMATAHGGTNMAQWSPQLLETTDNPYNNTLYGAMLGRIGKIENQVAGILWYQGESDAESSALSAEYQQNLQNFISTTRTKLNSTRLPFVYVQISRTVSEDNNDSGWNEVREAQRLLNDKRWDTERVGAVSSIDLEMDDYIHLSAEGQKAVGHRLAVTATNSLLKNKAGTSSPTFGNVTFEQKAVAANTTSSYAIQSTLLVRFKNMDEGEWKSQDDDKVLGFTLHDSNGELVNVIYNAEIQQDKKSVRLFLTRDAKSLDSKNVFLYYGYGMDPICNMVTKSEMGLLTFGPVPIELNY
ncbi:SGNH hydrolase-type esterase domain-containing protein [Zychaea mexicana]|uniref:SGNH hydrolase-type esterase domain-containing protein n=1 Tax=Zychaea mexicana TaxID=64656 RepID=UPI0022FEC65A|nr:SGNH hydrolase-type esterase domain-containing protein [Zychaea mexicana]KAI9493789.1 SGNH hydrolase-type esterase domain-containing protein [Zychaea mexicana]